MYEAGEDLHPSWIEKIKQLEENDPTRLHE